jgi:hypothetical protein
MLLQINEPHAYQDIKREASTVASSKSGTSRRAPDGRHLEKAAHDITFAGLLDALLTANAVPDGLCPTAVLSFSSTASVIGPNRCSSELPRFVAPWPSFSGQPDEEGGGHARTPPHRLDRRVRQRADRLHAATRHGGRPTMSPPASMSTPGRWSRRTPLPSPTRPYQDRGDEVRG